jgi:hypothetical protein
LLSTALVFALILLFITACGSVRETSSGLNTKVNAVYRASVEDIYGQLSQNEHFELRKQIEKELNTRISDEKTILINFNQKAPNCITARFEEYDKVLGNVIRISSAIRAQYNTVDFFVFTKDSFHHELFEKEDRYKLDFGYFYNNIFTMHENCEAFLILKPNGQFMKHYGEDYFTRVQTFLEKR